MSDPAQLPAPAVNPATRSGLPELDQLADLIAEGGNLLSHRRLCRVSAGGREFSVDAVMFGNPDPALPAIGLFGGIHGLERIGTAVVLAFMRSMLSRLRWDGCLHHLLDGLRVVVVPLVNPGGMFRGTRANPAGVDLMRNAPVECSEGAPFLVGGQRLSASLPWFRGVAGEPMQVEAQALCELVEQEITTRDFAICVDCHSGFGVSDRLWFPHAHTPLPIEHLAELHAMSCLLDDGLLHHRYTFEPQSRQYLAHGDLWDHLYLRATSGQPRSFLPLTLEMGSWLWVKKNPRQFFSRLGIFNPLIGNREQRVLRRHLGLIDFLMRAAFSHAHWLPRGRDREWHHEQAMTRWYGPRR